jgi:GTPase
VTRRINNVTRRINNVTRRINNVTRRINNVAHYIINATQNVNSAIISHTQKSVSTSLNTLCIGELSEAETQSLPLDLLLPD